MRVWIAQSSARSSRFRFFFLLFFAIQFYLLSVPTIAHTCIKILNYIKKAPTCFDALAPSSGSFDIVFAKVMKYKI